MRVPVTRDHVPGVSAELTFAELDILKATPGHEDAPCGPNEIGIRVWGERYHGSACSAPWARPAGRILNRLRKAGLVERAGPMSWWKRTLLGSQCAAFFKVPPR
jgi:hypothetical protein